jgi:orotate phosphoribosyltransferase
VSALREAGLDVMGMVAIFTYDFDIAKTAFQEANVELHTLTDYHALLQQALKKEYITEEQLNTLKVWRENPAAWSAAYLENNPNG